MNDNYEITCSRCMVTFTGKVRSAVDTAFRGHEKEAHGFMTGQEFYDRFKKNLAGTAFTWHTSDADIQKVLRAVDEAARKAAGLE